MAFTKLFKQQKEKKEKIPEEPLLPVFFKTSDANENM